MPVGLSCVGSQTWQHGNSLVNYMKMVSVLLARNCVYSFNDHTTLTAMARGSAKIECQGAWRACLQHKCNLLIW